NAGRALRHLANPVLLQRAIGSKRISVYPLVQPHPDVSRLARAFLASARQLMAAADRDYPGAAPPPAAATAAPHRGHSRSAGRSAPATSQRRRAQSPPGPAPDLERDAAA
ncbi:MAG: hypothetical protein JWP13_595, partial [Candidatus Saccharibacteria bacterium]|nr:hypothetical protein [Candidatus Saccharibacteria bacterium]